MQLDYKAKEYCHWDYKSQWQSGAYKSIMSISERAGVNQFNKGKASVVKHKIGKGYVTYIGVDTDDSKLEKDILQDTYTKAGATTEDYPEGIYVYWRDGFYIAVNYSSDNYTMNLPPTAKILVGENVLKPADVLVWSEK
jgi:beta-galactosidase